MKLNIRKITNKTFDICWNVVRIELLPHHTPAVDACYLDRKAIVSDELRLDGEGQNYEPMIVVAMFAG